MKPNTNSNLVNILVPKSSKYGIIPKYIIKLTKDEIAHIIAEIKRDVFLSKIIPDMIA
jgi:hypothetical protein